MKRRDGPSFEDRHRTSIVAGFVVIALIAVAGVLYALKALLWH